MGWLTVALCIPISKGGSSVPSTCGTLSDAASGDVLGPGCPEHSKESVGFQLGLSSNPTIADKSTPCVEIMSW